MGNWASIISGELFATSSIIENLNQKFPGVSEKIMENNSLKHFVNIYINGEDIRYLDSLNTEVSESDEIAIVPAVAGG